MNPETLLAIWILNQKVDDISNHHPARKYNLSLHNDSRVRRCVQVPSNAEGVRIINDLSVNTGVVNNGSEGTTATYIWLDSDPE